MKHAVEAACITLGLVFLGGCYESPLPLGPSGQTAVDEKLIGGWLQVPDRKNAGNADNPVRLAVIKFNQHEYFAVWRWKKGPDCIVTRAYCTPVDGVNFINVQNIKDPEAGQREFIFFKYAFSDDGQLVLEAISQKPLLKDRKFDSSEQFRQFVKRHLDDKNLLMKPVRFKRSDQVTLDVAITEKKTAEKKAD